MELEIAKELIKLAKQIEPKVVAWRRDIHRHPELGCEEHRTASLVERELKRLKIEVKRVDTGVIGTLRIGKAKDMIALRADMDALQMQEETGLPYASEVKGVAHMCGHDSHVAMLLGVATILAGMRRELKRSVRFIFQPSEEKAPGGALKMIKAGALRGVNEIFGLHVESDLPSGRFGVKAGPLLAAADGVRIKVIGKGGHGAAPHLAVDPVPVAAEIILALQQVVSRRVEPIEPAVVSICTIHGGSAFNVIPESVELGGTVRTMNEALRRRMPALIKRIANNIAKAHGARCEVSYTFAYPALSNAESSVRKVQKAVRELFGEKTREMRPRMGAEDFAYYLQKVKGTIIALGTRNPRIGAVYPLHSPHFILDESVLHRGVALAAYLAIV